MLKLAACLSVGATAYPDYLVCNDPRFDPGSKIMGSIVERDDVSANLMVEAVGCYDGSSSIPISFSGLSGRAAIRVLPKQGYSGQHGSLSTSDDWAQSEDNCPSTYYSKNPVKSASFLWMPHPQTYGDVDVTIVWGTYGNVKSAVYTLCGPPMPNSLPSLQAPNASTYKVREPTEVKKDAAKTVQVNTCVAPSDGTYNLPNAPVFVQKLRSKSITFPSGQCVPCRDDYEEKCLSARVICPAEPGALAVQHLFIKGDCEGEPSISKLPTKFVHCPGPEHYSPDNLDLERFVKKLQKDHSSYFPDEGTTRQAISEYRRMLHIIQKFPDMSAVPSKLVDLVWHEHILDTQTYRHDSQRLFGKYIHHAPSFGDESDEDVIAEKMEMVKQQQDMLEKYVALFSEEPSAAVWPLVSSGTSPVRGGGRLPDCCAASCVKVNCVSCVGCNAIDCGKLKEADERAMLKRSHVLPEYFAGYVPLPDHFAHEDEPTYLCNLAPLPGMTFSWTIAGDNIFMQQTMDTKVAETWHAVGFTDVEPFNMGYADYMVSMFAHNYTGVRDMYKFDAGNHYPCWDVLGQCSLDGHVGSMDLRDTTNKRERGTSSSSWWRALVTADSKDSQIIADGQKVMFARGEDDQFIHHGVDNHVTCNANFFTGESDCARSVTSVSFV